MCPRPSSGPQRAAAARATLTWGGEGPTFAALSIVAFSLALLVCGVAAIPIGRSIDRHGVRGLMTASSLPAAALVWAWSRLETLGGLYFTFAALGLAMAAVLHVAAGQCYEPALTLMAGVIAIAALSFFSAEQPPNNPQPAIARAPAAACAEAD